MSYYATALTSAPTTSADGLGALGQNGLGDMGPVVGVLATASMAASAYHGYKRNDSVGWALWWGLMGGLFPIITPVIAVAQGFGQKAK